MAMERLAEAVSVARASMGALFVDVRVVDDSAPGPVFAPAPYAEAFALVRVNRFDAAVARLRESLSSDPLVKDPVVRDPAARTLDDLRRAARSQPRDERAQLALAAALVAARDAPAARDALVEAVRAIPDAGQLHWALGRVCLLMSDEACALGAFQAAARFAPIAGAGHLHAAIARLHHNRLDLDDAAAAYRRRVIVTANDSAAHLDLGDIYRAQGDLAAALTEFLIGALLDPASARAFASIGQVHAAEGRDAGAVAALRRAIGIDGSHLEARYALSRALMRLGQAEEARSELETYEQLHAAAMAEERRRFKENQVKIGEVLETVPAEPAR
jgi:tetratricopeptide (TPR) repeat protein